MKHHSFARRLAPVLSLAVIFLIASGVIVHAAKKKPGGGGKKAEANREQIMVRMRIAAMEPATYARLRWHWGGQGVTTSDVETGELTAVPPQVNPEPSKTGPNGDFIPAFERGEDVIWVKKGAWLNPVPLNTFKMHGLPFITFTVMGKADEGAKKGKRGPATVTSCTLEVELSYQGKVIKTFKEEAPEGSIAMLYIPMRKLGPNGEPTPEFIEDVGGILSYSKKREAFLMSQPWVKRPLPKKYAIVTDCFGMQGDFAAHTANKEVLLAELRSAQQLGVNGFRVVTSFAKDMITAGQGFMKDFRRARIGGTARYDVPPPMAKVEGAGCPYNPATLASRPAKVQDTIDKSIERSGAYPIAEEWLLTQDEIGAFYTGKKQAEHLATCDYCHKAFREFAKSRGYTPADFGVKDWSEIMPTGGYLAKAGYTPPKKKKKGGQAAKPAPAAPQPAVAGTEPVKPAQVDAPPAASDPEVGESDADDSLNAVRAALGDYKLPVSEHGWGLLRFLTREFNNETSAMLLGTVKNGYTVENEKKRKALAAGKTTAPEATQPWMYSYSLRRSSYIMGGDSLDYFDFYRKADGAFMYETSDRDPRIWHWDSYMSDVGRSNYEHFGTLYGMCLKPHRGATIQRALAAVSRGARMIYWYTYGPNWAKGDSFSGQFNCLKQASWAARAIAAAEDVTYDAKWAFHPEVAVVRSRSAEVFENSTSWENGKWIYSALMNAHIPVDALSESMLVTENLTPYKVIYLSGPNLRKDAAEKIAKWVMAGGTLYTSGGGFARDEGNQPLPLMNEVLGVKSRKSMEEWRKQPRYGSVGLGKLKEAKDTTPPTMTVAGGTELKGKLSLLAGREILDPMSGVTVLAQYQDKTPAVIRHAYGKGQAYLVGFYAGVEYSADIQDLPYDTVHLSADKRNFVSIAATQAGVKPVVDASDPLVEGVLVKNQATGKQAVFLMNWACAADAGREREFSALSNVKVVVRGAGAVKKVRSAGWDQDLSFQQNGADIVATLPNLVAGDILLLE